MVYASWLSGHEFHLYPLVSPIWCENARDARQHYGLVCDLATFHAMATIPAHLRENKPLSILLASIAAFVIARHTLSRKARRTTTIPRNQERVVIIGASSGVGREIAKIYASRGALVCLVGRRQKELDEATQECLQLYPEDTDKSTRKAIYKVADSTDAVQLVALRDFVNAHWGQVDTLFICAGVSSLRPLLEVAGSPHGVVDTTVEGIQHTQAIAQKAIDGNFIGPLSAALTFIPFLQHTSPAPAIHLVSSLAALIPPPTRTLYSATKASSLMLFRALSIEHPRISFSHICPGTIQGNFRASAVDVVGARVTVPNGGVRENLDGAMSARDVAKRCIRMVDEGQTGVEIIPLKYKAGFFLSWLFPAWIDKKARQKYDFTSFSQ